MESEELGSLKQKSSIHRFEISSPNANMILPFVSFVNLVRRSLAKSDSWLKNYLIQELPWIENPIRIESVFDGSMQIKRGFT